MFYKAFFVSLDGVMDQFSRHINELIPQLTEKKIYVAVSGGVDSMVLLHLCCQMGLNPTPLHCNFKLRGEDSDLDEALVRTFATTFKLPFKTVSFDTTEIANKRKLNTQACARALRYEWFDSFLKHDNNAVLLTAHHLDDTVETFFTNLLRGTGLKGLIGIPEQRGQIYRPLLKFKKSDLITYAEKHQVPFRDDESNASLKYLRNKIRHTILPEIEAASSNFQKKMFDLQSDLKSIDLFLEDYTAKLRPELINVTEEIHQIHIEKLLALPKPILQKLLGPYEIQRSQIKEIEKLCESLSGAIFENEHFVFLKDRNHLLIKKRGEDQDQMIDLMVNELPIEFNFGKLQLKCEMIHQRPTVFDNRIAYLDFDRLALPIKFTNQYKELKIQPLGMKGNKLVSDILSDAKQNKFDKENQLVVLHQNDVIWVANHTINHRYALTEQTKRILKIEILE